jgi:shikimate dehydrogenase
VRGILTPLLGAAPAALTIANRTFERAATLAAEFAALGRVRAVGLSELDHEPAFDIVIHASSAWRSDSAPTLPRAAFGPQTLAYDLSYGQAAIGFLAAVRALGVEKVSDGLGMLVEQAAESFARWHGVRPQTAAVLADLRALVGTRA